LHLLLADPLGGVHVRFDARRPVQHRPSQFSGRPRRSVCAAARARTVLDPAEPGAVRREGAGGPRASRCASLSRRRFAVRLALYRLSAAGRVRRVLAARLQMRTAIAIVVACVLLAGAATVQAWRDATFPENFDVDDAVYISSPTALRRMTMGFNTLASDLYWI